VAARHQAYPSEALAIFEQLGIDNRKESEIWHTHRDEFGLHHYGGFFHLVGTIESGKDADSWGRALSTRAFLFPQPHPIR
jgi:hypothetical protein